MFLIQQLNAHHINLQSWHLVPQMRLRGTSIGDWSRPSPGALRCRLLPSSDRGVPRILEGVLGVRGVPTCAALAAGDVGPKLCGDESGLPAEEACAIELAGDDAMANFAWWENLVLYFCLLFFS